MTLNVVWLTVEQMDQHKDRSPDAEKLKRQILKS